MENGPICLGIFDSRDETELAIAHLESAGLGHVVLGIAARDVQQEWGDFMRPPSAAERAAAIGGPGIGGLWGMGIAGDVHPLSGPVVAGGLLTSILASAEPETTCSLAAALIELGFSAAEARAYEPEFLTGRVLVVLDCDDQFELMLRIVRCHGTLSPQAHDSAVVCR